MTLASSDWHLTLDTVLLKVASRCNLDCAYCYVYHMGDEAWRDQPKLMSAAVVRKVSAALGDQYRLQDKPFSVVLHGGEPLMLGRDRLAALCESLRAELPHPCGIHLQTNGVLLTEDVIDVLVRFDVGVSVSVDGPAAVHDRFRKDHRGRGSHARVAAGISRMMAREDARPLLAGVLCVIDPTSDPALVYETLKATGSPSVDFLVRDGNWEHLPFMKASPASTEYGSWLVRLLRIYLADPSPPRVRLLDDMLRLVLGGPSQKEGVGETDYGIIIVEPDGRITKNDTLKAAHAGADQFRRPPSIMRDTLAEVLASDDFAEYYAAQRPVSPLCATCPDLGVCGGGMVAHRWNEANGFANPTVFCADQRLLIAEMRSVVAHHPAKAA